jgi:predicted NBD/HSP70 family sugar kinase
VHAKRALLARHHVVAPSLKVADAAAASVFGAARLRGPIARDVIAQVTKLSIATVNRQVTALLDAGILRERADLAVSGAIGRPRVPVEVNHEPFLTLGIHIGARTTSIVATDLFGRTLDAVETPTPRGGQAAALAALADSARRYLSRWHRRTPLWVGVAAGGIVDSTTGYLDHPRLGWSDAPVGPVLAETLSLPVSVASHVDAMAGAELLLGVRHLPEPAGRRHQTGPQSSTSLYVYARETVGYALSIGGRVHSPASGPGTIAALPAHSELLGGSGQLESTVSDEAVLIAARKARIIPAEGPASTMAAVLRSARQGNERAHALLAERARVLGEAVALLRDMLNPDDLVVGGQAFTEYPEGMNLVEAAYAERSVLPARDIRVTAFGNRVQEAGAGVVSLGGLYSDPIGAMRRAQSRRHEATA